MTDTKVTQVTQVEGGNTITPSTPNFKSRRWCITWNNYTPQQYDTLTQLVCDGKYIIAKEGKGDGKTPHIQGYVEWKNAKRFSTIHGKTPGCHWEKAKGTIKQNFEYCSKEGDFDTNIDLIPFKEKLKITTLSQEYKDVVWKPWQQEVIDIINAPPLPRIIKWFWEPTGNVGKTYLAKYLCLTQDVIICDGKKDNIFNQINCALENKRIPKIMLIDIPRSSLNYVNYSVLEKVKDGCIYSGKYEGGQCVFPIPHVIVFANEEPTYGEMSADRWNVTEVASI